MGRLAAVSAVALGLHSGDRIAGLEHGLDSHLAIDASPCAATPVLPALAVAGRLSFVSSLQFLLASARAQAQRKAPKKRRNIAAAFADGASASSPAWRWAMRVAAGERLPILFVSLSPAGQSRARAPANRGLPAIAVGGNDVVALYRVASEALAHARCGNGPTLIECVPWPFARAENGALWARDPILDMERYLTRMGIPFQRTKRKTENEFGQELQPAARDRDRDRLGKNLAYLALGCVRS